MTSISVNKPLVIGVAGGTGSGKTTVARSLVEIFVHRPIVLIPQDAYYRDQSHLSASERAETNYDHPLAFDNDLLVEHLDALCRGESVNQPVYNFVTHTRAVEVKRVDPAPILVVEGILVLEEERLRQRMDIKVYVDTDSDERFIRRLGRDMLERGRSVESIVDQYLNSVRPMHLQFVEPTKRYADLIIPEGGANLVAIDLLAVKIRSTLDQQAPANAS
ncbi:MAG: uridine kinase [Vulcanimicrobiota bacterium]